MALYAVILNLEMLENPYRELRKLLDAMQAFEVTSNVYLVESENRTSRDVQRAVSGAADQADSVLVLPVVSGWAGYGNQDAEEYIAERVPPLPTAPNT